MTLHISAPISVGELFDKLSILSIKNEKIQDPIKLKNTHREFEQLKTLALKHQVDLNDSDYLELKKINLQLWDIEDQLRDLEKLGQFDKNFIELARRVYITNDMRFKIKSHINQKYGSDIHEEKSYSPY